MQNNNAKIHDVLKPGALFVLTALNGLRKIREYDQEDVVKGRFDPLTLTDWYTMTAGDVSVEVRERGYVPSELVLALHLSGFETLHIWGGTAGNWGRRPLDLDEIQLMVVARRP